jgi:MraZ protein
MDKFGWGLRSGKFNNTLDDKGRIIFPAKLRAGFSEASLIITQGIERCLWLFCEDEWQSLSEKILESASLFNEKSRLMFRCLIAPAQKIDFDKSDRLAIPQSLREYAGLTQGDCVVLGMLKYIELWDAETYKQYAASNETSYREAAESFEGVHF